jgi:hypothetical protein
MKLEQLEQELKTQISILEEEESRLKDWLESLHQVENMVVCRGLDSALATSELNPSSQFQTPVERAPFDEDSNHLRSACTQSVNPKDVFEEQLDSLRQKLSIRSVKRNW